MTLKHVRNGTVWLGGWLMGLSMAVAQTPPVCPVQPDPSCEGLKPPDAMVRMMSRGPAESCNRDDGSSSSSGSKCKFKVKVVAATKDMPRCWAFLPYSGLDVQEAKKGRTIRWTIDPAVADHEFDGHAGIKLTPVAGSGSSPANTWNEASGNLQKYRLRLEDPRPAKFCHYPQVRDKKANQLCCPADPVIANEP